MITFSLSSEEKSVTNTCGFGGEISLVGVLSDGVCGLVPRGGVTASQSGIMASQEVLDDLASGYGAEPMFPTTELAVDLKLLTRRVGRPGLGMRISGAIVRDDEGHFTFVESVAVKRARMCKRNPLVYRGRYVNVHRNAEGKLYPTFRRPALGKDFGFADFCLASGRELMEIACLGEEGHFDKA